MSRRHIGTNPLHAHNPAKEADAADADVAAYQDLPEVPEPSAMSGKKIVSEIEALQYEAQLNRRRLFLKLCAAWLVFFILTAAIAYFAFPLIGISLFATLVGPMVASLPPVALGFTVIAMSAVAGTLLSSFVFVDKAIADNFSTNFNLYRWHQILPQIFSNAYRYSKTEAKVSPWQIINLIAHLHFIVGGLQLILNKAFHQLYNKKVTYKTSEGPKEVKRNVPISLALLIPRFVLAIPFLLILLPLNLIGSFIEQANHALYRLAWYCQDKNSFEAATKSGSLGRLSPASRAADTAAVDWITNSQKPGRKRGARSSLGMFPPAAKAQASFNPLGKVAGVGAAPRVRRRSSASTDADDDTVVAMPRAPGPATSKLTASAGSVVHVVHDPRASFVPQPHRG